MTSSNQSGATSGKIGVLGGTFDPIHIGHLVVADNALQQLQLDTVLFAPAGRPPHKPHQAISSPADRIAMIQVAIADRDQFQLSEIDLGGQGPSFTVDLLQRIDAAFRPDELYFVMGADSLRDFASWARPEAVLRIARLAVAGRPGVRISDGVLDSVPGLRENLRLLDSPLSHISSTDLRHRLRQGRTIRYLIPDDVHAYIIDKKLYQASDCDRE